MERFKKILLWLLFPHIAIVVLLVPIAAALLIHTFAFGSPDDAVAYVSYFLSAYALVIICVRAPRLFRAADRLREENPYVRRYIRDTRLRMKLSLYISVSINILYALLQLVSGIHYGSVWFYALSVYYTLLAVMRLLFLRDARRKERQDLLSEYRRYRFCGVILLLINLALGVIVTYIVWQNRGFVYHEILTIAMAAYTFFTMSMAIVNVLKYRHHESPELLAVKTINLTAALVSLLSLETAMLSAFGSEDDAAFRQIITAATGAVVCLLVLSMAIYMIVRANREIKQLQIHNTET